MKITVAACCCFFLILATCIPAQEQPAAAAPEQIWTAMVAAWERGGEQALHEYVRQNKQAISRELIVDLAKRGMIERSDPKLSQTRLSVALVAAREMADTHAEADALRIAGDYCS